MQPLDKSGGPRSTAIRNWIVRSSPRLSLRGRPLSLAMRGKVSSILDYPRRTLDPAIWDLEKDPPILREETKDRIIGRLLGFLTAKDYIRPELWIKGFYFIGSAATVQYRKTTDMDVNIVVDWDIYREVMGKEGDDKELSKEIVRELRLELNGEPLPGTMHPLDYWIRPNSELPISDAVYSVLEGVWIVPPPDIPESFLPSEEFGPERAKAEKIMLRVDQELGRTRRGVIDYNLLKEYLEEASPDVRETLEGILEEKVLVIEEDLEVLAEEWNQILEGRREAFRAVDDDEDGLVSLQLSRSWAPSNIQFKYLERYRYKNLLAKLRQIMEDGLAKEEIPEVAELLGTT